MLEITGPGMVSETTAATAIDYVADEVPVHALLIPARTPRGRLTVFRLARRAICVHGSPEFDEVPGHPVDILPDILYVQSPVVSNSEVQEESNKQIAWMKPIFAEKTCQSGCREYGHDQDASAGQVC